MSKSKEEFDKIVNTSNLTRIETAHTQLIECVLLLDEENIDDINKCNEMLLELGKIQKVKDEIENKLVKIGLMVGAFRQD